MPRVAVVLSPDSYLYSVGGLLDAFQIANDHIRRLHGDDLSLFDCKMVALSESPVELSGGIRLIGDTTIDAARAVDLIYLPAFAYKGMAAFDEMAMSLQVVFDWIQGHADRGCMVCANCTGTLLLAKTGLLDGKRATTAWWLERAFRRRFPRVRLDANALLVEDEGLMTSGAMTAHLGMAVHLIERHAGPHLAASCAKTMLIDTGPSSQQPYQELLDSEYSRDPVVAKVQYWLQNHLGQTVDQKSLADQMNISQRTLIRRFRQELDTTPLAYLQAVRIEAAKRLLENSVDPLAVIIDKVGYADVSSFSRLFKKKTGLTPYGYRQRFSRLKVAD